MSFKQWDISTIILGTIVVVMLGIAFGAIWYEATFDYTKCQTTFRYREQHSSMWTQNVNGVLIVHPARNWTERLYNCPNRKGTFAKWRTENQP